MSRCNLGHALARTRTCARAPPTHTQISDRFLTGQILPNPLPSNHFRISALKNSDRSPVIRGAFSAAPTKPPIQNSIQPIIHHSTTPIPYAFPKDQKPLHPTPFRRLEPRPHLRKNSRLQT